MQHRSCCAAAGALLLLVAPLVAVAGAGCKRTPVTPLGTPPPPQGAVLPDRAAGETVAALRWFQSGWFSACGGRFIDGQPPPPEAEGQCRTTAAPGATAVMPAAASSFRTNGAGKPPPGCAVVQEWASGDPNAPPARALLVGPRERQVLEAWSPPAEVDGDRFAVEVSFSPDGKWMGVARSSIGVGDGERLVRVESVEVRPAPSCR